MGSVPDVSIVAGGDTLLCNGLSSYIMEVHPGAGVSIEWEFNGQLTNTVHWQMPKPAEHSFVADYR